MIDPVFMWLTVLLSVVGNGRYALHTLRGETQPNRVTWFLWGVIPLIAFFAEINEGVGLQSMMTLACGLGPLLVFTASLLNKKAFWQISRLDIVCGVLSVVTVVLWRLSGSGDLAIALSMVADGLAGVPTLVKSWHHPESETDTPFLLGCFSASITLMTIKTWNFANFGFPAYILVMCLMLFCLVRFKLGHRFGGVAETI
ncbi:MAG: hypothetical protein KGS72_25225 [Cyanobacteria bacterium REEB67]|nr:hypothetical protein [Cyanobacteria bacterium REEB67]